MEISKSFSCTLAEYRCRNSSSGQPDTGNRCRSKSRNLQTDPGTCKTGKTILINTLEIPEIQKVADYCAVFYNGEIIKVLEHQEIDEMTVMMYSTNAAQAEEGK